MDKISVIVPVYKVEKYIEQCMESILNQTYDNLEIILVDDGSPDNCGKICDSYAERDSRVKAIHKENGGAPAARNDALQICTGDWIAYVDPDDWVELNAFEEVMRIAKRDDPDIIIFNTYINTGNIQKKQQAFPKDFVTTDRKLIYGMQLSAMYMGYTPMLQKWSQGFPWDKVYKASMIKLNNILWPTHLKANDDVVFVLHAFQYAKKISYSDKTLYHYRMNPNSIGHKYTQDRVQIDKDIYAEMRRIKEQYNLDDEYDMALYARIVLNIWLGAKRCFFHPENKNSLNVKIKELRQTLKEEPFYTAFEKVDRSKLHGGTKIISMIRHNNALWIYFSYLIFDIKNRLTKQE